MYIEQRQATVDQWVAISPLFDVCARDTGYEGGGSEEEVVVAPRGDGKTTLGHPGRLAGN